MVSRLVEVTAAEYGSIYHLGWLFSLCLMLGTRPPRVSSHNDGRSTKPKGTSTLIVSFHILSTNISLSRGSHIQRQKSKVREVHSTLHEVMVRMWIYAGTIGEYRSEINN